MNKQNSLTIQSLQTMFKNTECDVFNILVVDLDHMSMAYEHGLIILFHV
jgi:hypothetical protein